MSRVVIVISLLNAITWQTETIKFSIILFQVIHVDHTIKAKQWSAMFFCMFGMRFRVSCSSK
jgi:hypothetical protein